MGQLGHVASGVGAAALEAWVHAAGSSSCSPDVDPEESRARTIWLIVSCTLSLVIGLRWHARGLQGDASPRAIG